jgi:nitrate/nitrite transport system substrate-binding protein
MISRNLQDPFDPHSALSHPAPRSASGEETASELDTHETRMERVVESAVVRAIFGGNDMARRRFLQVVGAGTAAEIIRSVFPFDAATPWLTCRRAEQGARVKGLWLFRYCYLSS